MRTIKLHIEEKSNPVASRALGYLATWALSGYDQVSIYPDGNDNDLIAVYTSSTGEHKFVMGAIWHEDEGRYSFHS
jgi:hypothetical protein